MENEKSVELVKEEPEKQMTKTEKVIAQLNEKIKQAEESGSYFVAITRKEGDKLIHWQGSVNFIKEDCAHSLREQLKNAPKAYKESEKIRRFGPVKK